MRRRISPTTPCSTRRSGRRSSQVLEHQLKPLDVDVAAVAAVGGRAGARRARPGRVRARASEGQPQHRAGRQLRDVGGHDPRSRQADRDRRRARPRRKRRRCGSAGSASTASSAICETASAHSKSRTDLMTGTDRVTPAEAAAALASPAPPARPRRPRSEGMAAVAHRRKRQHPVEPPASSGSTRCRRTDPVSSTARAAIVPRSRPDVLQQRVASDLT